MKTSRYNLFFNAKDGNKLGYNLFSGALIVISRENRKLIKGILDNPVKNESPEVCEFAKHLLKAGFLLDDDTDEMKILKVRNRLARYKRNTFSLTIAPTLDCNFRCHYCFEKIKQISMNLEIQNNLLRFTERALKNISSFFVLWYGGEPLLRFDIISRLSEEFIHSCSIKGIEYNAGLITNGYLLDDDKIDKLSKYHIRSIQITIDGPKYIHDKRRKLEDGGPTFDRIMHNIEKAKDKTRIDLRVNTDKENQETVLEVLRELDNRNIMNKIMVDFAPVFAVGNCSNYYIRCFTSKEFSAFETKLHEELASKGGKILNIPLQKYGVCSADSWGSFVIDPEGNLYKCVRVIGENDWLVGNIADTDVNPRFFDYLSWDPFEKENCAKCIFLPICMGGCPQINLSDKRMYMDCTRWKYNIRQELMLRYKLYKDRGGHKETDVIKELEH